MEDCSKCKRTDIKCCFTCKKDAEKCKVYHHCGSDCPKHEYRKITNADKIRSMSDEELAEFLHDYINHTCSYCKECKSSCTKQNLEWLQSEAE